MVVSVTQLYFILTSFQVHVQLTSYIKSKVILYEFYDLYSHFNFYFILRLVFLKLHVPIICFFAVSTRL